MFSAYRSLPPGYGSSSSGEWLLLHEAVRPAAWLQVPNSYFHTEVRYQQWQRCKALEEAAQKGSSSGAGQGPGSGSQHASADAVDTAGRRHEAAHHMQTVGAVAVDCEGRLAAATSTGGRSNKWDGRIGDTPINGAGGLISWLAGCRTGADALRCLQLRMPEPTL